MANSGLSEKELALLAAARKEAAARKHPAAKARRPARRPPIAVENPAFTPLDQPTVMGWEHPAARQSSPRVKLAAEEKLQQVAALLESEHREEREKRARLRKRAGYVMLAIVIVMLFWTLRMLSR
jgi:hypothetical protein